MKELELTALDRYPWVDFNRLNVPGTDMLVCGQKGSGKTAFLMVAAAYFLNHGETVIWRDDGRLEILSMIEKYPMRIFIPQGCTFSWSHPNAEILSFDVDDVATTMLGKLARDRINVLLFDLFNESYRGFVMFWASFFERLYHWKLNHLGKIALFVDEFNDIAPAHGRGKFTGHKQLSEYIWVNMKKYRAVGIRLVASSHGYKEIHDQIRDNFVFHAFKRMSSGQVPRWLERFMFLIPKLPIDLVFVTEDQEKKMRLAVELVVNPKPMMVPHSGSEEAATLPREDLWRNMYFQLLDFCLDSKKVRRKELMTIHNKKRDAINVMIFRHREQKQMEKSALSPLRKPEVTKPAAEIS